MDYLVITEDKFEDVIDLLRQSFPDEPLNASVGLSNRGQPSPLLEKYDLKCMAEGFSIMAVDKETGTIAGVALNGVSHRGDVEKSLEEIKNVNNIAYQRIFGLLNNANYELDLFNKYNVDEIFEFRILAVDSRYRGKGIAKELYARTEKAAIENGFKLIKVDATSFFTQKICESFGLIVEKSIRYHDFLDENGKKIYDTESPHDYYKVMTKELPSND